MAGSTMTNLADGNDHQRAGFRPSGQLAFTADQDPILRLQSENDQPSVDELRKWGAAYKNFGKLCGKDCVLVRCLGNRDAFIMEASVAARLDSGKFRVLMQEKKIDRQQKLQTAQGPPGPNIRPVKGDPGSVTLKIPRPRNKFILYRQWKSKIIRQENPGLTAGLLSKIIAGMWRSEKPEVIEHFTLLATQEGAGHRERYPDYRYTAARKPRVQRLPVSKAHIEHDPMTVADRIMGIVPRSPKPSSK
ncbi:hypothetical protein B0T25DRAFT_597851 [Lasiosphaeria hispida]|uniref:HMG box domain-containing protein n=1 Tax=Lasiosphaeria hispida TaxID=260671 RepID=A0AAJ0HWF4_9PEZI|nr:hypothetical protein B0T25DRAFT_597851 [Lasiosphaeria hispida]